uniref:Protein-serine/threonine phosphatase n=1 Tax=Elaeophora elaphi TaxID=1147741 RepID=A0A0R3RQ66_9BILA
MRRSARCSLIAQRHLLSKKFALNEEWSSRHHALSELGIEGGYEWITAVQKKFISAGMASPVDVDAAVCIAEELDQLDDVLKIVYKLRHIEMTGRMLPSTEYALIRLLLKHHKTDILLAILADPINYGIFLNEHSACLVIDNFLEADKFTDAARVAIYVMLQEMFQSALLNWLCIYSSLRWIELPIEQRVFKELPSLDHIAGTERDSGNVDEEDEVVFKFPYLKNEYNDMHFDLTDPDQLIGKNLLWFSNWVPLCEEVSNIRLIGAVFFGNYILAKQLLQMTNIFSSTVAICRSKLEQAAVKTDDIKELQDKQPSGNAVKELTEIIDKLEKKDTDEKLSDMIMKHLKAIQNAEEENLIEMQCTTFLNWRQNRADLIKAQVEQLDLKLRLKETREERQKLKDRWEVLNFFENRLKWEDIAAVKEELLKAEHSKRKIPCQFLHAQICFSVAERLSESAHIVDHDPSLALYRLHEHVGKTLPALVARKYTMTDLNSRLHGACFDLDNVLLTVQSMKKAATSFENIQAMLRDCIHHKQQLNCSTK